jgi:hypothetical protein
MVRPLPIMSEALGSIPSIEKKKSPKPNITKFHI